MRTNSTCHALCLQEHALNCCQDWMHSKSTASSWHPVKGYNQLHPPTLTTVGHISQSYWCVRGSRRFAFSPAGQHSMPPHVVSAMATACNDGNLAIWATAKCRQRACLLHQQNKALYRAWPQHAHLAMSYLGVQTGMLSTRASSAAGSSNR